MTTTNPGALPKKLPKTYEGLVALHVPRPIHDEVSYQNTVQVVDALAGMKLNRDQEDFLEILSQQIEAYEAEHLQAPKQKTGLELVRLLLEENDLSGNDLAELLGVDRSVAYKILKGTRNLTVDHVRRLAERFAISADAILGPKAG
jgi:Predicted transcription regulator containing HTH domain